MIDGLTETAVQLGAVTAIALFLVKTIVDLLKNELKEVVQQQEKSTESIINELKEFINEIREERKELNNILNRILANEEKLFLLLSKNGIRLKNVNDNSKS